MKKLLPLFLTLAVAAFAQTETKPQPPPETFPGVKAVMSPEDFARSGLSGLNAEQLGLIDAAIIRHYTRTVTTAVNQQTAQIAAQIAEKNAEEKRSSFLSHFGLPQNPFTDEWRDMPALNAKCVGWVGGNRFKLDNGQVWEGFEQIPVELENKDVQIAARPGGQFALMVDGNNTTIRVHRVK